MKHFSFRIIGSSLLAAALLPALASAQEGKATIAVSSIKATPSWRPRSSRIKSLSWEESSSR
jgi:hypothetical protein